MTGENVELQCYNRGCGQKFNPNDNDKDVCQHHPGLPFFHDAYKGWSCCKKKCIDFTEFLNIKGCTFAKHSNEKPPEMPKSQVDKERAHEVIEVKMPSPVKSSVLMRPPLDSPLTIITPIVAEQLKTGFTDCPNTSSCGHTQLDVNVIMKGTCCKNGGCKGTYEGPQSDDEDCVHHPGVPIFHEGMKYWSCCQKKTTDFNNFLNQVGCKTGTHKWKKDTTPGNTVKCRWDWHQTPSHVVIAVYAKNYHPSSSSVKLNPIRLCVELVFPKEDNAKFNLDLELRGMVNVEESSANMYGTKLEIKLRKAEAGSWAKLDFPKVQEQEKDDDKKEPSQTQYTWDTDHPDVDLEDLKVL